MDMKKLIISLGFLAASYGLFGADQSAVKQAKEVVWVGLDYSLVRMYGTADFKRPEEIFPDMFNAWNSLFLQEWILHKSARLQKALGKEIKTDIEGMVERNKLAKTDQVIRQDGAYINDTHITDKDIAAAVKSYKLSTKSGIGLVYIVDRLVKVEAKGAVYVVFFDLASRQVLASERQIGRASGGGFRNYWFRPIKEVKLNHFR
jgi:hypothetical protein